MSGTKRPSGDPIAVFQYLWVIPLPLLPGDDGPPVDLNAILHARYERARFDLRLDYSQPPVPPLDGEDAAWAGGLVERMH